MIDAMFGKKGLISSFIVLGLASSGSLAHAQEDEESEQLEERSEAYESSQQAEQSGSKQPERIQVTGSRIKRLDAEGPSPITRIEREDIQVSGVESVGDLLRNETINSFGSRREKSGGNFWGESNVDLRGLGVARTLVLLNGKRISKQAGTGGVDLNSIPLAAVERIEILRDGASAIYGTDALGGVVNIITRSNFDGMLASVRASLPQEPGGESRTYTFYQGTTNDRSSTSTMITYNERQPLAWTQRPNLTDRARTYNYGGVGNYQDANRTWRPFPNCPEDKIYNGSCVSYYFDDSVVIPEVKTLGILTNFEYRLTDDLQVFGNLWGVRKEAKYNWGPYSTSFDISKAAASNMVKGTELEGIFDEHTGNVTLQFQLSDLGPEIREIESTMFGGGLGLRGHIAGVYEWELYLNEDRSYKADIQTNGAISKRAAVELMQAGKFNPFASGEERGSLDHAEIAPFLLLKNYSREVSAQLSGPIFSLPYGSIEAAAGVIHLSESFTAKNDPIVDWPEVNGSSFQGANFSGYSGGGARSVTSAFVETVIPAYEGLELQLAARMDRYSDFGSSTNPKVALRYSPIADLYIRGSAGTGFKAPTLDELYRSRYSQFVRYTDRRLCPVHDPNDSKCRSKSMHITAGGNPDLVEEGSEFFSYGLGYEIIDGLTFTVDYWSILLKNAIGYQDLTALTEAEAQGLDIRKYAEITRDATTQEIVSVVALNQNLGRKELKGIDYTLGYRINTGVGRFHLKSHFSKILTHKSRDWPAAPLEEHVGTWGRPEWRSNSSFGWRWDAYSATWTTNIVGPQKRDYADVGDYPEHGLHLKYLAPWDGELGLGVQNVFDRPIPTDEDRLYSYLGRRFIIDYTQNF